MLKYFYITKDPEVAKIAQSAGVDRIFIDMEYIGKELRQPQLDTVKNRHTVQDVKNVRKALNKSELLVRVNPIHANSENEINEVIAAGADVVMLPMWKSVEEVKAFLGNVAGRAKAMLLLEHKDAVSCLDEVLRLRGIDEIHIGLNDLYLSQKKTFMFELLVDGTVDSVAEKIKEKGIPFGIGGVGAVKSNMTLPAENILAEHYRLGSSMAILARAFCDTSKRTDYSEIEKIFNKGIKANREYEAFLRKQDKPFFDEMHRETENVIESIKIKIQESR